VPPLSAPAAGRGFPARAASGDGHSTDQTGSHGVPVVPVGLPSLRLGDWWLARSAATTGLTSVARLMTDRPAASAAETAPAVILSGGHHPPAQVVEHRLGGWPRGHWGSWRPEPAQPSVPEFLPASPTLALAHARPPLTGRGALPAVVAPSGGGCISCTRGAPAGMSIQRRGWLKPTDSPRGDDER
jgi:hypothetical protein